MNERKGNESEKGHTNCLTWGLTPSNDREGTLSENCNYYLQYATILENRVNEVVPFIVGAPHRPVDQGEYQPNLQKELGERNIDWKTLSKSNLAADHGNWDRGPSCERSPLSPRHKPVCFRVFCVAKEKQKTSERIWI